MQAMTMVSMFMLTTMVVVLPPPFITMHVIIIIRGAFAAIMVLIGSTMVIMIGGIICIMIGVIVVTMIGASRRAGAASRDRLHHRLEPNVERGYRGSAAPTL